MTFSTSKLHEPQDEPQVKKVSPNQLLSGLEVSIEYLNRKHRSQQALITALKYYFTQLKQALKAQEANDVDLLIADYLNKLLYVIGSISKAQDFKSNAESILEGSINLINRTVEKKPQYSERLSQGLTSVLDRVPELIASIDQRIIKEAQMQPQPVATAVVANNSSTTVAVAVAAAPITSILNDLENQIKYIELDFPNETHTLYVLRQFLVHMQQVQNNDTTKLAADVTCLLSSILCLPHDNNFKPQAEKLVQRFASEWIGETNNQTKATSSWRWVGAILTAITGLIAGIALAIATRSVAPVTAILSTTVAKSIGGTLGLGAGLWAAKKITVSPVSTEPTVSSDRPYHDESRQIVEQCRHLISVR